MERWKLWLLVSGICSLICAVISTIMYVFSLFYCEPEWIDPFGEVMGGYCSIVAQNLELWWIIPFASFVGFLVPSIALVIGVVSDILP